MSAEALLSAADGVASARTRRLRTIAWAALPLSALVYYALLVSPLPPLARLVALELVYCTPIVLTVLWSMRARSLSEGRESTFWASLAGANFTLLLCELLLVYWVAAISPAGPPRVSWPFHVMHAVAAVFFIAGLASLSRWADMPNATRCRLGLDIAAVFVVLFVGLTSFYALPIMAPAGASMAEVLLGAAYPLFALMMIGGTVANVVGFKVDRWRPWDKLFTVALAIYACAIALWPLWYPTAVQTSRNYERGVLDLVQFSGHWLLMAAAAYRLTEVKEWRLTPVAPVLARRGSTSALGPAVALLGLPMIALLAARNHEKADLFAFYIGSIGLLAAIAVGRSILVAMENGSLFHQSVSDPLTGLYNRRFLMERLGGEIDRADRYREDVSIAVFDLDDFTTLNSQHGLAEGERILRRVSALLSAKCPAPNVVARLGDDEFALIMPETGLLDATVRVRGLLDAISISGGLHPRTVTACAGLSTFPLQGEDAESLLKVAQAALYQAKQGGPENLYCFEDERVPELFAHERIEHLERQSELASVRALAAAIEASDDEVYRHCREVADLAVAVGARMGLSEETVQRTECGALLHEAASIATPQRAAQSGSGKRDWDLARDETALTQRILSASGLTGLVPIVRSRYEWWDGTGRPEGLAGEEIPVEARVLAACHYYEWAVTGHVHRHALTRRDARVELLARSGTQFDPAVVAALASVLDSDASVAAG